MEKRKKVTCPYCGHVQKVEYNHDAKCFGLYIKCQARHCKKEFEIILKKDK